MKLILEKNEIVTILGKHFEAQLDPEKVIIRTDPFEMELSGLPLGDAPPAEETNVVTLPVRSQGPKTKTKVEPSKPRADENASTDPPPPGNDGVEGGLEGDVHPAAVLATSKQLEAELERENPQLKRRSGQFTYDAPKDQKDEIG